MKLNKEDVQSTKEKAAKRIRDLTAKESLLRTQIRQLERKIDDKILNLFEHIEEFTAKSFMGLAAKDSKVVQTKRLKSLFLEDIYPKRYIFFENPAFKEAKLKAVRLVRDAIANGEDVLEEIQKYSSTEKQLNEVVRELEGLKAINSLSHQNISPAERKRIENSILANAPKNYSSSNSSNDDDFYNMYYWMWRNNSLYEPVQREQDYTTSRGPNAGTIDYTPSNDNYEVRSSDSSIRGCDISNGASNSGKADSADSLGSSRDFACNANDSYGSYS